MKPTATPLVLMLLIAAAGIGLFAGFAMWWGLNITVDPTKVASILAPLIMAAAFIERAVEVVISPWRDAGANRLQSEIDAAQANPAATANDKKAAAQALVDYTAQTQRYAFTVLFLFGLCAAMVGIRTLWPFVSLDPQNLAAFKQAPLGQKNMFIVFDVVLSAALMAGGANGLHSMVTMFTSFFDATGQKAQNSTTSQTTPTPAAGQNPQNAAAGQNPQNAAAGQNPQNAAAGQNPQNAAAGQNPQNP